MDFLKFLKEYWLMIVYGAMILGALIVAIWKKRGKLNLLDTIKAFILGELPTWISYSENLKGSTVKLNNVVSLALASVKKFVGRDLNAEEEAMFIAFITDNVEKILATPQKKLENKEMRRK